MEYEPPRPINLQSNRPHDESGFVIVHFKKDALPQRKRELAAAAKESVFDALVEILEVFDVRGRPLINSLGADEIERLEQQAFRSDVPPLRSLSGYWRLDTRRMTQPISELEGALRSLPEVDLVYREKTASDPVNPADDPYSGSQKYLDPAPDGVDARWFWTQQYGDGVGMHFVDLEKGWLLGHEDLPAPKLIFNDNKNGLYGYVGYHGTAVLGVVAAVDNTKGIIGIAPNVTSVRTVSSWTAADPTAIHVADALMAAVSASPPPHVMLIEVQVGAALLPAETEEATLDAIRIAVGNGIIVVEAGGNGNQDLDAWTNAMGRHRLNRSSAEYVDSYAIVVGGGDAKRPHDRGIWGLGQASNYGSRLDCYAWGDSIVSSGYGDRAGAGNAGYTSRFGATSGASAIISGCALLLQAMHFATKGSLLSPQQMRAFLSDPATGTAQGTGVPGQIGVMPNLRAIAEVKLGLSADVDLPRAGTTRKADSAVRSCSSAGAGNPRIETSITSK